MFNINEMLLKLEFLSMLHHSFLIRDIVISDVFKTQVTYA